MEEEALTHDEPERPLKRLRLRGQGGQVSPSVNACNQSLGGSSVKRPKVEEDELPKTSFRQQPREIKETPQRSIVNKGKQPLLPQIEPLGKRSMSERTASIRIKEPMAEPGIASLPKPKVPDTHVLIKPKDEPFTDDMFSSDVPDYEVPIAVIRPGTSLFPWSHISRLASLIYPNTFWGIECFNLVCIIICVMLYFTVYMSACTHSVSICFFGTFVSVY